MAVVEHYPELKADQNFLALQEELIGTESKIAYARQFYNDQVTRLNTAIEHLPVEPRRERVPGSRSGRSSTSRPRAWARAVDLGPGRLDARADRGEQAQDRAARGRRRSCSSASSALALGYVFGTGADRPRRSRSSWRSVLSVSSYFYGDRFVLASSRAREVTAQEQPRLHNLVEGLAIAAGVPKPRIYVVPEQAPNAFATGRDPEHSSIAVTRGPARTMNRVELEGVIGHELSHVLDRDILLGTIVATLVGAAVLMSEFFMRSWLWGGIGGRRGNDNERRPADLVIFARRVRR